MNSPVLPGELAAMLAPYPVVVLGVHHAIPATQLVAVPLMEAMRERGEARALFLTQVTDHEWRHAEWPVDLATEGLDRLRSSVHKQELPSQGFPFFEAERTEALADAITPQLKGDRRALILVGEGRGASLTRALHLRSGQDCVLLDSKGRLQGEDFRQELRIEGREGHWQLSLLHPLHRTLVPELFEACSPPLRPALPRTWFPGESGPDASLRALWRKVKQLFSAPSDLPLPTWSNFETYASACEDRRLSAFGLTPQERLAICYAQEQGESISFPFFPHLHLSSPSRIHAVEELTHCLHLWGHRIPMDDEDRVRMAIETEAIAFYATLCLCPERNPHPPSPASDAIDGGIHRAGYTIGRRMFERSGRQLREATPAL